MNGNSSLCVVDTNVAVTANGKSAATPSCVHSCAAAVQKIVTSGQLALDEGWEIIREYKDNLSETGQPGVGDHFVLWVLRNRENPARCVRVPITPRSSDEGDFEEFPDNAKLEQFDPSDRKFVAVAAAHPDHPPIFQAVDSKWWGWKDSLAECDIRVVFLCRDYIVAKYAEKQKRL